MYRIRLTRLHAAAAAALLSLSLAAPALAHRDDWDDDDHGQRRGHPVYRHGRSCDYDGRGGHYGGQRDPDGHRDRGYWDRWERGYRRHHAERYGCRPCGRRWRSEGQFHRHLYSDHRVPYRAISRVLVYVDWGWVFRG